MQTCPWEKPAFFIISHQILFSSPRDHIVNCLCADAFDKLRQCLKATLRTDGSCPRCISPGWCKGGIFVPKSAPPWPRAGAGLARQQSPRGAADALTANAQPPRWFRRVFREAVDLHIASSLRGPNLLLSCNYSNHPQAQCSRVAHCR